MSWTDKELDSLFNEAAQQQKFEYKPEYWKDIEMQLPLKKNRKPLFWWFTASVFIIGMSSLLVNNISGNASIDRNAALVTMDNTETDKITSYPKPKNKEKRTNETIINTTARIKETQKNNQETNFNNEMGGLRNIGMIEGNSLNQVMDSRIQLAEMHPINSEIIQADYLPELEKNEGIVMDATETTSIIDNVDFVLATNPLEFLPTTQASFQASKKYGSASKLDNGYLEINGGIGQSWTKSEENRTNVNGQLGISGGYSFQISQFKLTTGIGVNYTRFTDLKIQERTKIYGFGSQILENSYQFNSIYAVSVPLTLFYSFGRHSLGLGLTASWNFMAGVSKSQFIDGEQTVYSRGISNANLFNRFGVSPSVSYDFSINEKFRIGVRSGFQLLQPIQSDRFVGAAVKMPFESQFYIRRTLNF